MLKTDTVALLLVVFGSCCKTLSAVMWLVGHLAYNIETLRGNWVHAHTHNRFTALFPVLPECSNARRNLL